MSHVSRLMRFLTGSQAFLSAHDLQLSSKRQTSRLTPAQEAFKTIKVPGKHKNLLAAKNPRHPTHKIKEIKGIVSFLGFKTLKLNQVASVVVGEGGVINSFINPPSLHRLLL